MDKEIDEFLKSNQSIYGEGYTSNIPDFFSSLRQGFNFYFRTFQSNNSSYENYTFSFDTNRLFNHEQQRKMQEDYINKDFTDKDNFLLSIVSFQRFFELLIKDVLQKIDERLVIKVNSNDILSIINPSIKPEKFSQKIEAGEALSRIKKLYKRSGENSFEGDSFPGFENVKGTYEFLSKENNVSTIGQLNSWRNAMLHGGTVFPNLRALDYFFCKHIIPLVCQVFEALEQIKKSGIYYYLETMTGINLLAEIALIQIDITSLRQYPLDHDTSESLLRLGHIKELGRANMEMNLFKRLGHATYEYNDHDVFGRGLRFAEAEKLHEHFKAIKDCPCCGKKSLVLYEQVIDNIFNVGGKKSIQWVTCYTCSYHIRYNVGDPYYRGLSKELVFDYKPRYSLRSNRPIDLAPI